jgi:N-acetylmuramoyl-L-alanine amidase
MKLTANRKVVRYGLVSLNVLLLLTIGVFTLRGTHNGQPLTSHAALNARGAGAAEPLDQLSSADIAANASIVTGLPETTAVINQADSAKADLNIAPADTTVVAKPQPVATALKSRKDIQNYVVPDDTTIADIAAKFSVTSDSITWSNSLSSSTVKAGTKLVIPPVGVNGIVYIVKGGDTVDSLSQKYRANRDQIIAYNDIELTGLKVGEQIIIPNGQQPAAPSVTAFSYLGGNAQFGGYNGYDYGFCTYYAAKRRAELGNPVPSNLGNANTWAYRAAAFGIPTGGAPRPGAVAMKHSGAPGHVAIVEVVNDDGSFWISEMNSSGQRSMTDSTPYGGWGRVDWKIIPASLTGTYTYIY